MLKELEAHLKGLINEINIHDDNPEHITITIHIDKSVQTLAVSKARVYTSTSLRGDEDDVVFVSLAKDQFTESFLQLENQ